MTYTQIFEQLCPEYMLYGMSYEQYWFGDPWMARAYAQKHLLARKQRNEELWLEGIYLSKAFGVVLHNAFDKHKEKYFDKPLEIFAKTDAEIEEETRQKRRAMIAHLQTWMQEFNMKQMGAGQNGKS